MDNETRKWLVVFSIIVVALVILLLLLLGFELGNFEIHKGIKIK